MHWVFLEGYSINETVGKGSAGLKWKENVLSLDITLHDSKILQQNIFILLLKA